MAQVCLRVCAVTCLDRRDGQDWAALPVWMLMRCSIASRLSGRPVLVGNSGSPGWPLRSASQARRTVTVPGSDKTYNEVQVNDPFGPPDWFPGDHAPLPKTVAEGLAPLSTARTAADLFAHRHTIRYRLDRVKELTRLDVDKSEDRERLTLGIKAMQLLGRVPEKPSSFSDH